MNKRVLITAALTFVLAFGCFVSGCTTGDHASDEELVTQDLTAQLDQIAVAGSDAQTAFVSSMGDTLASFGVDPNEFATRLFDGFSYTIDNVTVEEASATVDVTVHCKQLDVIIENYSNELEDNLATAIANGDVDGYDTDAIYAYAGQLLLQYVDGAEFADSTCTITYTKLDGEWSIDDGSVDSLTRALLGENR